MMKRAFCQFLYNQDAVTNFAISNTIPITIIENAAVGNIAIRPTIENQPATADTARADAISSSKNAIYGFHLIGLKSTR